MPRVKVDVRNKDGVGIPIEIQCEPNGLIYTFQGGQIAEINNPREYARVCQIRGVKPVDERAPKPPPPPVPTRGPGRPRKHRA